MPLTAAITRVRALERERTLGGHAEAPRGSESAQSRRGEPLRNGLGAEEGGPAPGSGDPSTGESERRGDGKRDEVAPKPQLERDRASQAAAANGSAGPVDRDELRRKAAAMRAAVSDLRSEIEDFRLSLEGGRGRPRPGA